MGASTTEMQSMAGQSDNKEMHMRCGEVQCLLFLDKMPEKCVYVYPFSFRLCLTISPTGCFISTHTHPLPSRPRNIHMIRNSRIYRMGLMALARLSAMIGSFVGCLPHLLRSSKYRRGTYLSDEMRFNFQKTYLFWEGARKSTLVSTFRPPKVLFCFFLSRFHPQILLPCLDPELTSVAVTHTCDGLET